MSKIRRTTPEEAVEFLDAFQKMMADKDEPTKAISLRVPGNLLRALKIKAKADKTKYQTLIIHYIREGLSRKG